MPLSHIFNMANMSFNTIRENKILANILEFIVSFGTPAQLYNKP